MLAMFQGVPREIQELLDAGVSVVAGEVEHRWHELLRDAWEGRLQPIYRLIDDPPDLHDAACPKASREATRRYVSANYATIRIAAGAARSTVRSARSSTCRGVRRVTGRPSA
jgi:hypothetical protein